MTRAGSAITPGPFNFRGCDLTAEWLLAREHVRAQFPATAPSYICRAPACAAESPKLRLPGAAPGRRANRLWGRGRQAMHLPCKQIDAGALPADSTISLRETRPTHRDEPHKLIQVGVTPTPATSLNGKRSSYPTVNRVSQNKIGNDELEYYQRFPPFRSCS